MACDDDETWLRIGDAPIVKRWVGAADNKVRQWEANRSHAVGRIATRLPVRNGARRN
jgi:hypothetical protein